jgi:hypothetical protein
MKYEKPRIEVLGTAITAVKGLLSKDTITPPDGCDLPHTVVAYEAEE